MVWEDLEIAKAIKGMLTSDMKDNRGLLSFLFQMAAGNRVMVDSIMRNKASGNKSFRLEGDCIPFLALARGLSAAKTIRRCRCKASLGRCAFRRQACG